MCALTRVTLLCGLLISATAVALRVDAQRNVFSPPYTLAMPVKEPHIFAEGVISTNDYERGGTFTRDGHTFYFVKRGPEGYFLAICVSHYANGGWTKPEIAPFSGQYPDYDPLITPDGSKMFFTSRRPFDGRQDADIWVMDKASDGWSEPRNLGAPINTPGVEGYATITRDGTLYFHSSREGGKGDLDIYRSRLVDGKYTKAENLGDVVNTKYTEAFPQIASDESFLIFVGIDKPDEIIGDGAKYPRGDLYIAFNRNGTWTTPKHIDPPINTPAAEVCPFLSPDGKYLFFTSERGFRTWFPKTRVTINEIEQGLNSVENGLGNIYQVDLSAIGVQP